MEEPDVLTITSAIEGEPVCLHRIAIDSDCYTMVK